MEMKKQGEKKIFVNRRTSQKRLKEKHHFVSIFQIENYLR